MIIGVCRTTIHIPGSVTLKDKRSVVKSLKDKIKHRFNASVAEVDDEELWQKATLGIACVSNEKGRVSDTISAILRLIENNGEIFVVDTEIDFL